MGTGLIDPYYFCLHSDIHIPANITNSSNNNLGEAIAIVIGLRWSSIVICMDDRVSGFSASSNLGPRTSVIFEAVVSDHSAAIVSIDDR